jgi:hypothetical protein
MQPKPIMLVHRPRQHIEKQVRFKDEPKADVIDYGGGLADEELPNYEEAMECDHIILSPDYEREQRNEGVQQGTSFQASDGLTINSFTIKFEDQTQDQETDGGVSLPFDNAVDHIKFEADDTNDTKPCFDTNGTSVDPIDAALMADMKEKKLVSESLNAVKRHLAMRKPHSHEYRSIVLRCGQSGKAIGMAGRELGMYRARKRNQSASDAERAIIDQRARERAIRREDRKGKKAVKRVSCVSLCLSIMTDHMGFRSATVEVTERSLRSFSLQRLDAHRQMPTRTTSSLNLSDCTSQAPMGLLPAMP